MLVYGADLTQKIGVHRGLVLNFDQLRRNSYSTFRFKVAFKAPRNVGGAEENGKPGQSATTRRCTISELDEECIPSFQVSIGHETTNLVTLRQGIQGSDGVSVQSLGKWFMFCSVFVRSLILLVHM